MVLNIPEAYIEINLLVWQKVIDFSNVNWNVNFWDKPNSVIIHDFFSSYLRVFMTFTTMIMRCM